jgi:hypothetical protein
MAATALVIDGIGASAAQIADGLVGGLGHVNGGEFSSAQESGDGPGVALIGFERRAGLFWDERGSGDQTRDLKLFEAAGDHKTARAGFVGNFEVRARMSFADSPEGFLQAVDIVGDGAE